ncbi:immunoglobulin E-set [Radiomyces spectabilis]|uniref:immunoglobulin E-set n=1 Tax=Radiomyces spectabilis TaxID=64574 RepID=UPI002220582F|nr:immunoglobulin E-set [Radiomyces spectabilis]KAI8388834.1 immunoglobulin E-set [Radiomyces spectabilis]
MRDWLLLPPTASSDADSQEATGARTKNDTPKSRRSILASLFCRHLLPSSPSSDKSRRISSERPMSDRRVAEPLPETDHISSSSSCTLSEEQDLHGENAVGDTGVKTDSNYPATKIAWNHGGQTVYITGEFDNWSGSILMTPEKNSQAFTAELFIDRSVDLEYKFIVDGQWCCASDLPQRTDAHGHVNNVLYGR